MRRRRCAAPIARRAQCRGAARRGGKGRTPSATQWRPLAVPASVKEADEMPLQSDASECVGRVRALHTPLLQALAHASRSDGGTQ